MAAGLLLLAVTACTTAPQADIERDTSAVAQFDQTTGEIRMPISDYALFDTMRDLETFNQAFRLYVRDCMTVLGHAYRAAEVSDIDRIVDDRQFGIWFEEGVRLYGFGFEPSEADPILDQDRLAGGDEWASAEMDCSAQAEGDPDLAAFLPTNAMLNDSLVASISTDAYRLASSDPLWNQKRQEWWSCLRDEGLTPLTGANDWGTEQDGVVQVGSDGKPTFSPESLQVAYQQVVCNEQVGMSKALADLEASYQQPLIEKNQAALNEAKTDKQTRLAAARAYIAAHG